MGTSSITGVDGGERGQPKNNRIDAVFTNKKDNSTLTQSDFMKLMVAQMQNQDFMNPADDSKMVEQMVQFSNMQQMEQMASWSRSNYAMTLIGKTVTATRFTVGGSLDTVTGPVQKVSLVDDEYVVYVGGKKYEMGQIMEVSTAADSGISSISPENYPLTLDKKTDTSAEVTWKVPTEDDMVAKGLKYTVYYSKEGPFNKLEDIEKGTVAGVKEQKGNTTQLIADLEPNTTYYINVVVTDGNGVKSVYKPTDFKTRLAGAG